MTPPVRCPSMSPTLGRNPGSDMEYWLRYDMPTLRTIIMKRAAYWAGLYHHCLSSGSLGVMLSFI